jgi:hypothetical protein
VIGPGKSIGRGARLPTNEVVSLSGLPLMRSGHLTDPRI